MRNNVILLLILTVMLISGCADEYDITVINKSSYPIDFEFTTGHRLGEYRLEPGEEWHYSLPKVLDHSMGTFKPLAAATAWVDYRYSDYVYTFYDAFTLAFNANSGILKKGEKTPAVLTVIQNDKIQTPQGTNSNTLFTITIVQNDKIQIPDCSIWEKWHTTEGRYYVFSGWAVNAAGTGTAYPVGSLYTVNENISANITLYAKWE